MVLKLEIVTLARFKVRGSVEFGRAVVIPFVDQEPVTQIEPHAVVSLRKERERPGRRRFQLPFPADAKVVRSDEISGRAEAPVKIDGGINADDGFASEIFLLEISSAQPMGFYSGSRRIRFSRRLEF